MVVTEVNQFSARCEARGEERTVSLLMMPGETLQPGDHVLVHLGHAIRRVTRDEAAETWALLDEILGVSNQKEER